jgi:hypothetical protein
LFPETSTLVNASYAVMAPPTPSPRLWLALVLLLGACGKSVAPGLGERDGATGGDVSIPGDDAGPAGDTSSPADASAEDVSTPADANS